MIHNANRSGAVVSKPEQKRPEIKVGSIRSGRVPEDEKQKKTTRRAKREKIKVVDGELTVVTI